MRRRIFPGRASQEGPPGRPPVRRGGPSGGPPEVPGGLPEVPIRSLVRSFLVVRLSSREEIATGGFQPFSAPGGPQRAPVLSNDDSERKGGPGEGLQISGGRLCEKIATSPPPSSSFLRRRRHRRRSWPFSLPRTVFGRLGAAAFWPRSASGGPQRALGPSNIDPGRKTGPGEVVGTSRDPACGGFGGPPEALGYFGRLRQISSGRPFTKTLPRIPPLSPLYAPLRPPCPPPPLPLLAHAIGLPLCFAPSTMLSLLSRFGL